MRRVMWKLSISVILGSLGVAAVIAQEPARTPSRDARGGTQARTAGKLPFQRDRKATSPDAAANDSATGDLGVAESPTADSRKYVRRKFGDAENAAATSTQPKNYYNELFGDGPTGASGAAPGADADRRKTPMTPAARPSARPVDDVSDDELTDEELDAEMEAELSAAEAEMPKAGTVARGGAAADATRSRTAAAAPKSPVVARKTPAPSAQAVAKTPATRTAAATPALKKPAAPTRELDLEDDEDEMQKLPAMVKQSPASAAKTAKPAIPSMTKSAAPASKLPTGVKTAAAVDPKSNIRQTNGAAVETKTAAAPESNSLSATRTVEPSATVTRSPSAITPVAATASSSNSAQLNAPRSASMSPVVTAAANTELQTPSITLRWAARGEVSVGEECKCALIVRNNSQIPANGLVIEANFPRHVRLVNADPFPGNTREVLTWTLEKLAPGEEKTIEITMVPSKRGDLAATATVRCAGSAGTVMQVEEPELKLAVAGPSDAMVGETVTQVVTVANPGSGVAHDVVVQAILPDCLSHPDGKTVRVAVGALSAGETRDIKLSFSAVTGGEGTVEFEAKASGNLSQSAAAAVRVAAPRVTMTAAGPSLRYVNRNASYSVTIANDGVAATNNVRVQYSLPQGFEFVKAEKGGKFDYGTRSVSWFVGRLEAGTSQQLAVELTAKEPGHAVHSFAVTAEGGVTETSTVETRVDGNAELVLAVSDLNDPVEIGTETGWEIKVRNDGSIAAKNVGLACELPGGVELIDATGPTTSISNKNTVVFKTMTELAPNQSVTFRVRATGKLAGNLRFRARLTSDASSEPVILDEITKFYAD